MKTFTYTVRNQTGALQNGTIQAASRSEALARLRALGVVTVSIAEGTGAINKVMPQTLVANKSYALIMTRRVGVLAGVAVIGLILVAVSAFMRGSSVKPAAVKPMTVVTNQIVSVTNTVVHPTPFAKLVTTEPTTQGVKKVWQKKAQALTFPPPRPGVKTHVVTRKGVFEVTSDGTTNQLERINPLFDNPFENMLGSIVTPGGFFIPAVINRMSEQEIMEILKRPITIFSDDSEEVQAKKEAVAALKAAMVEYIDKGGSYQTYIAEMQNVVREERTLTTEGRRGVMTLLLSGNVEGAKEYYKTANEALQAKGLPPMKIPERYQTMLNDSK